MGDVVMNANQELSTFENILAVILGVFTFGLGSNAVVEVMHDLAGGFGLVVSLSVVIPFTIYLAYDRLHDDGMRSYQRFDTPFKRRYVKAMTGNAVFAVLLWVLLIVLFIIDTFSG